MSGLNLQIGDSGGRDGSTGKTSLGCLVLFLVPFFLGGLGALAMGIKGMIAGDRKAFIGVVVGSIFVLVASGLLIAGLKGSKQEKVAAARAAEHPDQPWLWNPAWATGEIAAQGAAGLWVTGFFALIWNGISWTATIGALGELTKTGDKKLLFVLIFPLVGLGLIAWFIYSLLQHRKFGVAKFRMLSVPGVLGGTLRGAIEVPVQIDAPKGYKVRLACVRRVTTGSGKSRSTSERVEWEDEKVINKDLLEHDRTRTGIPVFFNIPYHLPEPKSGNPAIIWRLKAEADVPGIDFSATFEVPVFKTAESREEGSDQADPTAAYQPNSGEFVWPEDSPIRRKLCGDTLEFYCPPGRNLGASAFLFVFTLIWTGAIWFMVTEKVPLLFPIVFGLFDALFVVILFGMLFASTRVTVDPLGLTLRWRMLCFGSTTRLSPEEIDCIKFDDGMRSGDKVWYDIKAVTKAGRRHNLAGSIPSKDQAAWIAFALAEKLGVPMEE